MHLEDQGLKSLAKAVRPPGGVSRFKIRDESFFWHPQTTLG
jgi:hypothetical protein